MPIGEIYIKLVVGFPDDAKVRALARYGSPDAGLARDLYVQMCLHCKEHLTDGFVSAEQIGLLVYPLDAEHGNQLAKQLASVGLTKEVSKDEASGWQVLGYLPRNGTREDVERLSKVRAEAGRNGGRKSRKRPVQRRSQANSNQVGKQVANQTGSNAVSGSVSVGTTGGSLGTDLQTPTESADDAGGKHAIADSIADGFWRSHKADTAQSFLAIRGVVRTAITNGNPRNDVVRALERLARKGVAISGGSLTNEIGLIRKERGDGDGHGPSGAPGPDRARGWMAAGREYQDAVDQRQKELPT